MKIYIKFVLLFALFVLEQPSLRSAEAIKESTQRQSVSIKKYTTEAKSKLVDELCECAVAAKITGILAIPLDDAKTQKLSSARTSEFLNAANEIMSSHYVEARYKSMLIKFISPNKLNDDYANKFIRERAHMCGYIIQNKYERLQYLNDIITKQ